MHGRGAGDDRSIVIQGTSSPRQPGVRLLENMVFICKPCVTTADRAYRLTWGDTFVVTESGARRWASERTISSLPKANFGLLVCGCYSRNRVWS
jgi:hypothetical protein